MNSIQQIACDAWQGLTKQNIIDTSSKLLETINKTALPIIQSMSDFLYTSKTNIYSIATRTATFTYQAFCEAAPYIGIVAAATLLVGSAAYCLDAYGIIKSDGYRLTKAEKTTPRIPDNLRTDMPDSLKERAKEILEKYKQAKQVNVEPSIFDIINGTLRSFINN